MDINLNIQSENVYTGIFTGSYNKRAIFGGTVLCQSILAAYKSVPKEMYLHSFQMYFISRGNPTIPLTYITETTMNGRSFVKRLVKIEQNQNLVANIYLSFKLDELQSTFHYIPKTSQIKKHHQDILLLDAIREKIKTSNDPILSGRLEEYLEWLTDFPFDIKPFNVDFQTLTLPNNSNTLYSWVRLKDNILSKNEDRASKHAVVGFISDYLILQPIMTMFNDKSVGFMVSLDHAMWLHSHSFDINQWLLLEVNCEIASNGMTLNNGKIWSHDGLLLASFMQQGVIRQPK